MRKKRIFERKKIIYRKVGKELIATYDDTGVYYEQTVHSACVTDKNIRTKYVLGIFNSSLLKYYYQKTNSQGGDIFPQIRISSVKNLPIKIVDDEIQKIIESIVDYILFSKNANKGSSFFETLINAVVFELYFPDHMKERKIDILQFVEKDIEEVMQDNEFETMSDPQKEQVITDLHTRWSNPNSEIVKRMNSFSEKSPEILKPILEG